MSTPPPVLTTKRRIKRIGPLQLGKMLALLYGIMGLIFAPIVLGMSALAAALPNQSHRPAVFAWGTGFFVLLMPILYAAMGFVFGLIGAVIYNLVARFVGGIEVEVE
jgi:hypothetical protein